MSRKKTPVHEPEVIQAATRKQPFGDDEKVPTTALKGLEVHGAFLSSRYDKAHELEAMAWMVEGVEPDLRQYIENIWCDSKATACYSVTLKECDDETAKEIIPTAATADSRGIPIGFRS